jgi:hypothetical protein
VVVTKARGGGEKPGEGVGELANGWRRDFVRGASGKYKEERTVSLQVMLGSQAAQHVAHSPSQI